MNVAKITISIDQNLLSSIDHLVQSQVFASRSQAVQVAVQEKIIRLNKTRLARECSKLDRQEEQTLADEGLGAGRTAETIMGQNQPDQNSVSQSIGR